MRTVDVIETLKDGLRPDVTKLLAFSEFHTVADLQQAALQIENFDEDSYTEETPKIANPTAKPPKLSKKEVIDLTATTIGSTPAEVVVSEFCSKEEHTMAE
jgi:hypothetical protein